ncbi:unnamed protein product [Coregonus sp. 'balchen']|nr:unnamed protein product [Coregonus sp. 'balchen']
MEFLWMILTLCALVKTNEANVLTSGPPTGIVLRDDPGLLITNCRVHTQRVYVRLDAENVYRQHIIPAAHLSWDGADWTTKAVKHAQLDTAHMLAQLQKFTEHNPDFYLTPNLLMCTLTKDVHYLCPSKPFVRDNTERLCGLKPITSEEHCRAKLTARGGVTTTQVEVVGNQWLINTPFMSATMTYECHDSTTQLNLPNQTISVKVPEGANIRIDNLALYQLPDDRIDTDIEMPFAKSSLELPPAIQNQI